jgi:O-acetyl-ADP-ribose deacetylase (regulator of RNase III)
MERTVAGARLELVRGDITQQRVDAIVNAANSGLRGGGGVDGAIHRAGGPSIMEECRRIGGCPTGEAVITTGGRLPASKVIHAVGPIWRGGKSGEADLLAGAYRACLQIAVDNGLRGIAFPSISTGAYRYPIGDAARIALTTAIRFFEEHGGELDFVRFVLFSEADLAAYENALSQLLPG